MEYAPKTVGNHPAILDIVHNGVNDNPLRITFDGSGMLSAPKFVINVNSPLDMGLVNTGSASTESIKISNMGNTLLTVHSITMQTGIEFSIIEIQDMNNAKINLPASVPVGEFIWVKIEFKPINIGVFQDKVFITHDATNVNSPFELEVEGESRS